jgi:hypothetical protein
MNNWNQERSPAQTIAGRAILLEIGAKLGILDALLAQREVVVADVAKSSGVQLSFVSAYYEALTHAGLATPGSKVSSENTHYAAAPDLQQSVNDVGYVLWGLMSCAPLISNAVAFARDMPSAARTHVRDGEHVARTSKWMGEQDFYPPAENAITASRPKKIVDLGSGTCGLLIRCLRKLPEAHGVGIDLSHDACVKAQSIIRSVEMEHRLSVVEAPIQSLIDNPTPVEGADVIHGGFVFHDLLPDEEETLDALLRTFRQSAPAGALVIVDAVPYAQTPGEQAFSAAFTFLHSHFMGRRFLTESQWKSKLLAAGYATVEINQVGISGGRIFTARPA